jgi:hypothetical protein
MSEIGNTERRSLWRIKERLTGFAIFVLKKRFEIFKLP